MDEKEKFFENIKGLANQMNGLMKQKFNLAKHEVDLLIKNNSRNTNRMEHCLDSLLECIDFGMGEAEFFQIIEMLNKLDSEAADDYLKFYEELKTQE